MTKVPMLEGLSEYRKLNLAPFSMPGHKLGRAFGKNMLELIPSSDITEVEGLDNLHNPQGIIKDAQELLKNCYESKSSYFLVNGSSSGNLSMIFAAFQEGDKVLIERNCHKSIYNGILLRKLKPVFLKNSVDENLDVTLGIDMNNFLQVLEEESDIKGIILTYPNYFGIGVNLKKIVEKCKEKGVKILLDAAHGAHFGFNKNLPENPLKYEIDMVVMSAHKTLPSLTQSAYLHINKEEYKEKIEFYLKIFTSTSPSYIFLVTLDYSRYYLQEKADKEYDILIDRINNFKDNVKKVPYIKVLSKEDLSSKWIFDTTKIVITQSGKYKSINLEKYLLEKGIQCEMSFGRTVVLISTPFNTQEDFDRLEKAILELRLVKNEEESHKEYSSYLDIQDGEIIEPYKILDKATALLDVSHITGHIAAENITPYPPGIPFIMMGEKISKEKKDKLIKLLEDNIDIIGIQDGKVKVVAN
ncbi:aminotransferase class I/II-fold pyridoxal phosphate-dependent enzyme [Clostridium sp. 'White wine YQ']|uniref:aminotransferase class I/II-fold pyridoxal phosphate-dependent enzyme n=1 Tax=Clostridium sp. 'White wine YQ' TaxID=3027474 RepID=UPI00236727CB|nr:aminotransferase class I/II-fold pyridoxal phosphate-dependent enzyme [Clostridium sp. 'White wine YQ']MDD7796385.1 aminotransferase class I/II-fold pyridoxal phosphate-dependent enzyme [Clostridium sp. 'White wine YQ']